MLVLVIAVTLIFSIVLQSVSSVPHWDKLERKSCSRQKCGWGVFEARLLDAGNDWEGNCLRTPLLQNGRLYKPLVCIKTTPFGIATGIYGRFELESQDCGKWGPLKQDQCSKPGHRQYSGVLYNVPSNWKWEDCCKTIDIVPQNGIVRKKADRCHNVVINEWGEFDIPDTTCSPEVVCKFQINKGKNVNRDVTKAPNSVGKKKRDTSSIVEYDRFKRQGGNGKPTGNTGFYQFAADLVCVAALAAVNSLNANNDPIREYRQGHNDRIEYVYAVVQHHHLNTGSNPSQAMRDFVHALGRSNDDAGHIIANRLGGTGRERYNIFPQTININRGVWQQTEATAANFLERNPNGFVEIFFTFDYDSNTATRPTRFLFRYAFSDGTELTGEIINP